MFAILNVHGHLWTHEVFDTECEARKCLERVLSWMKPDEIKHKIVLKDDVIDFETQAQYFLEYEDYDVDAT